MKMVGRKVDGTWNTQKFNYLDNINLPKQKT